MIGTAGSSFVPAKNRSPTATSGGFSMSLHEWRDLVEPAGAMTGAPRAEPDEVLLENSRSKSGCISHHFDDSGDCLK